MRAYFLCIIVTLLTACSTLPLDEQQAQRRALWETHFASLDGFTHWRASGRMAVSTAHDGGSARLLWAQRGDNFTLRLNAGLGQGTLQLSRNAWGARLIPPSGEVLVGRHADALLYRHLGWHVPIDQLRQWLTGRPGSASDYIIGSQGLLERIQFEGWVVVFEKYRDDIYPALPSKVSLKKADIKVRVIIDGWSHSKQTITSKRIALPAATLE